MGQTNATLNVVREAFEYVWNRGEPGHIGDYFSPDYICHEPDFRGDIQGLSGVNDNVSFFRLAFPDLRVEIADIFGSGDRVATRWVACGTHESLLLGIEPTWRSVSFEGITISRLDHQGKIAEEWMLYDVYGLFKQLGTLAEPEPEATEEPIGQPASEQPPGSEIS